MTRLPKYVSVYGCTQKRLRLLQLGFASCLSRLLQRLRRRRREQDMPPPPLRVSLSRVARRVVQKNPPTHQPNSEIARKKSRERPRAQVLGFLAWAEGGREWVSEGGREAPFYLRRSRQIRERKVLFFLLDLLLLLLLGDLGGLFSDLTCTLKKGASKENFSSKWVYPEKTFFKRGASREKFSSKRVHPDKNFLQKGVSRQNFSSKWVHQDKTLAFLLMWVSLKSDNIPVKVKSETNAADYERIPFLF